MVKKGQIRYYAQAYRAKEICRKLYNDWCNTCVKVLMDKEEQGNVKCMYTLCLQKVHELQCALNMLTLEMSAKRAEQHLAARRNEKNKNKIRMRARRSSARQLQHKAQAPLAIENGPAPIAQEPHEQALEEDGEDLDGEELGGDDGQFPQFPYDLAEEFAEREELSPE